MEIYNRYFIKHTSYESEIVFVDSEPRLVSFQSFYVRFHDGTSGVFRDKNEYLHKLERKIRYDSEDGIKYDNIVESVTGIHRNYTFIKVIKDEQYPELEGKIMLFYFGKQIVSILNKNYPLFYRTSFTLKMKRNKYRFPDYSDSYFTSNEIYYKTDLNIEDYVKVPVLDVEKMKLQKQRQEKLENLKKHTDLKDNIIKVLEQEEDKEKTANEIINLIVDL